MSLSFLSRLPHKRTNPLSILSFQTHFCTTTSFPDVPTSAYYDDLVATAGRNGDFDSLLQLLNKRFHDGCFNTTDTFKFLTNTPNSLSTLDTLLHTLSRLDHGYARKGAYDALVARLCKLDRVDEALRILIMMAREKYGINALSFHPVLNCLTRKKRMERAWRVVEVMRGVRVSPDVTAFNYLLTAYCYNGNITGACRVLKMMEEEGLSADTRTYDALVLGACRTGKVEGALTVLRRMEDDGLPVLYSTHAHVINAMLKQGYYAQVVKFVRIYGGRDRVLDSENYGILASKLVGSERFEEAKVVLEEMDKMGLKMGPKLREFYEVNFRGNYTK